MARTTTMAKHTERQFHCLYALGLLLSVFLNVFFLTKDVMHSSLLSHINGENRNGIPSKTRVESSSSQDGAFAACMLVMDDNHRLTEWLAYHYHVLPLDYLVLGVDPNSETSPTPILNQWRNHGMTIIEWNNTDIFKGKLWEYENIIKNQDPMPHHHDQRQNMFLSNCLHHMKEANRTWVLLTDSDEYLLFNGPSRTFPSHPTYPSIKRKGSVLNFIQQERKRKADTFQSPCIAIPRILFGAQESSTAGPRHKSVPQGFDAMDTIRYRKHMRRHDTEINGLNGWAKVIVDVSRIQKSDIPSANDAFRTMNSTISVHRPLPNVCPEPFIRDTDTAFRINHYVGSWEAFSFRKDARASIGRNKEKWQLKASAGDETDDAILEWLGGFVEEHGIGKSKEMLRNAGVIPHKK